jgi:putative ubiquitin-RnfH superfamily antitoxin RatB of RatAB toxin-antitoxin module
MNVFSLKLSLQMPWPTGIDKYIKDLSFEMNKFKIFGNKNKATHDQRDSRRVERQQCYKIST